MAWLHFCEVPSEAVCGYSLVPERRFYDETSNAFAHVSCPGCRTWLRTHKLDPGAHPYPETWKLVCQRCGQIVRSGVEDCMSGAEVPGAGTEPHILDGVPAR